MNAHVLRLFESAARHPDWIDPLGWILIHSLWQFALVAIVLGAALRFMSRHSSTARYAAALAALAAMVLLPAATWFVLPQTATIRRLPPDSLATNSAAADSVATGSVAADRSQAMTSATTASRARRTRRSAIRPIVELPTKGDVRFPPLQEAAIESPADDGPELLAAPSVAPALAHSGWRQRLESWLPTIVWGWLVGVLLFALRPIWSAWTVWQLRRTGTAAASADLAALFQRTTAKLGLRREVRLLQSAAMQVPAVIGYLRPVVLVPISVASGFPPEQLEALFAHELAHVRRHDYLVNLLQTVIETVFFYHPAIWWVSSQIRCERENCCDDVALRVVARQTDYAKALVALEALRSRPPLMTVAASHGSLLARIRRIVGINQEPKPGFAALLCAALVLAALAVGNMAAQTSEVPPVTKTPAPAAAKDLLTTAELNQSPYHVALPDGSVIALLGLGTSPADGNHWWNPDGTPLAQAPPKPVPVDAWGLPRRSLTIRGVALDAITQKGGTFLASVPGTTWYATPSLQATKAGVYERHRFVMGVAAKSSTSIFVNYFAKEWRTVGSSSGGRLNQIDFPEGNAVFVSVSENDDGTTESSVMYDVKYRDVRVVAVDRRNVEHPPTLTTRDTKSRLIQSQFQGIAPHQISEFRFQIRDSRKIEFRNVSLQPGQKTNVEIYIDGKLSVPQASGPKSKTSAADGPLGNLSAKTRSFGTLASSVPAASSVWQRDRAFRVPLPEGGEIRFEGICEYPTRGHAWRQLDGAPLKQAPENLPADTGNGWFPHSILREFAFETVTPVGQGAVHVYGLREHSFSEFVSLKEGDDNELRQHRIVAEFPEKSTVGTLTLGFFRGTWSPFQPRGGKDNVILTARVEFEPAPSAKLAAERTRARVKATLEKQNGRWNWHLDKVPLSSVESSDVRITGTLLPSDYQFRLVAVDRENHEHPTVLYAMESDFPLMICGPSLPLTCRNRPVRAVCYDLPRDKVKEFRFLTRPLNSHRVEFRNLSLVADRKTNVEIDVDGKPFIPELVSSKERAELPATAMKARPLETVTAVVAPSPIDPALDSSMYGQKLFDIPVLVTDGAGRPVAQATVAGCVNFRTTARTKSNSAGRAILKVPGEVISKRDGYTWHVVETRPPRLQYVFAVKEDVGVDYFAYHDPGEPSHDPHVPPAPGAEQIKLVLQGTRTVRIQLKQADGRIVPLMRVSPVSFLLPGKWCPLTVPDMSRFSATTDGEGIATLQNLPANNQGKIRLCIDGGRRSDIVVSDEFAFDPAAPVEQIEAVVRRIPTSMGGSVCYPDGKLAPRAEVAISGLFADSDRAGWKTQQNICDFDGHFRQGLEPNESYELSAWIGPFVSPRQTYVWHSGTSIAPVKLELQKGVRVHGCLTRGTSQGPVAGGALTLYEGVNADDIRRRIREQFPGSIRRSVTDQPLRKHSRHTQTDDQGRFEFFVLPGTYYLEAGAARPVGRENALFTITGTSEVEINFQLDTPDLRAFDGVVVLKSDPKQSVKWGMVEGVSSEAAHSGDDFRANCDGQGKFEARRAAREMLVYAASMDRSLSSIDRIPADAKNLVISVGPTASVHGRLLDRDGHPLVNRVIEAGIPVKLGTFSNLEFVSRTTTRLRGEFVLENLTPGWRWELAVGVTRGVGEREYESREVVGSSTPASATRVELGDLTLSTTESASPQQQTGLARKPIFHPENDANADIAAALATAKRDHKRVLLIWGTNWSPGCYRLDEILNRDKEIAAIVKQGFVPLLVDVGSNVKLLEEYGDRTWGSLVPFFMVLDADGKLLINQWINEWGFSWYLMNPDVVKLQKLQAFLLQWSPVSALSSAAASRG